ncbi:MAG: hypothetical protein AAB540_02520 [Patescibacteria group bacterium]
MKNITDKKLESILKNFSSEAKPGKMFMRSLGGKLQKQFAETYSQEQSFFNRFFKLKLQFASALVVIFFTSTTIYAYSSDSVVNGDLLYPLKLGTEKVEGLLAVTPERKVEYYNKMADRRMEEFTHLEQKRNRIDKPTLKEAKRLIELSEKEFTILEQKIEIQPEFDIETENNIQPEINIQSEKRIPPEFEPQEQQEHIIKVKEKIGNTRKHFEEKFGPRLEELEELEREMMKEITEDLPFNNFPPDIQNMINEQNPQQQPQQQPPKNFQPKDVNPATQPEPPNSDFPNNIQDPQQQPKQHSQPDTNNFPIQPEINDSGQPQPFSDYLKISTPKKEQSQFPPEQISPNVIDYDKEPQPQTQPFKEPTPQQFSPKEPIPQNYQQKIEPISD